MAKGHGQSPVVQVAKRVRQYKDVIVTLPTGVRAKLTPVSASLISDVISRIKNPPIPMQPNPDQDNRMQENPNDPEYLRAMYEADQQRGRETTNTMIMFGVTLIDDTWFKDQSWLKRLKFLEKKGLLDLSSYDTSDPDDLEYMYKRLVAVDQETLNNILTLSGVSPEDIYVEEESFPGETGRPEDTGLSA